jgi:serine/threonine protein phosphatase PrpC
MTIVYATVSEKGPRSENEDSIGVWELSHGELGVAIADGLGGHFGGKYASQLALNLLRDALRAGQTADLVGVARNIHEQTKAQQAIHVEWRDMATTLSAAVLTDKHLRGVHSGDTRIAVSRGEGIRRLTEDHSEVQRLLRAKKLTAEQARTYPRRNVLDSAIGIGSELRLDGIQFDLTVGDRLYFTSDGVHGKLLLRELLDISLRCKSPEEVVIAVRREIENRSPEDNYSIICCFVL